MKKSALRLPKLKTRDELLRTAPELGRFLEAADGEGGAGGTAPAARAQSAATRGRPPRSPVGGKRTGSPRRVGRKFSADETTEEERVRAELERVKAERAALLDSLAKLRADQGKSGGELQQEDIRLLRRELEAKQDKLNELRRATHELSETLEQLETTSRDCEQLMPQAMEGLQARVAELAADLAAVEQDILEAEAKHELYKLLEIRTRRDHAASEQRMREARALKEGASDDYTTLTKQMHEMRAAKEDAERELGAVVMMYDQVRSDWSKKLKDRRKEVRELEKRKAEDAQRKAQQAALAAEKARIEHERTAKTKAERDAANARLSAVVPELESLEATWARLHGICGANGAEDLIAYWQELRAKEANMRELVRLAEVREARAKQEMAALLAERAEVFDSETARGERQQQQTAPAAAPAAASMETEAVPSSDAEAAAGMDTQEGAGAPAPDAAADGEPGAAEAQGSSQVPATDDDPSEAGAAPAPDSASQQGTAEPAAAAAPEAAVESLLLQKQALLVEARRRKSTAKEKFTKLSQVCVAADQGLHLLSLRLKAAMEASGSTEGGTRRRSSVAGRARRLSSMQRRITGQQSTVVRRMSAINLMDRRASVQLLAVLGDASPRLPAGSGIHDKEFFPELPTVLSDVGARLSRLMMLVAEMESATAAVQRSMAVGHSSAVDAGGEGASAASSLAGSLGATEASEDPVEAAAQRLPSRKLQWAGGATTPRMDTGRAGEAVDKADGSEEEGEDSADVAAIAADGERALRKGFRRCTWAGPAWLDAVSAAKPLTAALRKQAVSPGLPVSPGGFGAPAALRRVVGYVEDPGSNGDEAGGAGRNPFDLDQSEDEEDGEEGVVDRQYLKHRAHKLTNPKVRGKQAAGGSAAAANIQVDTR